MAIVVHPRTVHVMITLNGMELYVKYLFVLLLAKIMVTAQHPVIALVI
jgi:hypothetical protein